MEGKYFYFFRDVWSLFPNACRTAKEAQEEDCAKNEFMIRANYLLFIFFGLCLFATTRALIAKLVNCTHSAFFFLPDTTTTKTKTTTISF
jgi:hypothetical protein